MRKLLLFIMCIMVQIASANHADPTPFSGKLADGSLVTLHLVGDENGHYYATADGTPMVLNAQGFWERSPQSASELQKVRQQTLSERNQNRLARLKKFANANREVRAKGNVPVVNHKGLVILVNFADLAFSIDQPLQTYQQIFNDENNPYDKNIGSVHEYFRDQSYGQFNVTFDVVGPVTVSHDMAYYGGNDPLGNDTAVHHMVKEACLQVDDQVNFKDYDWNGDGTVDQVYLVYAGMGEAYSGSDPNTIWPHEWDLWSACGETLTLDGVIINTYACSNEIYGSPRFVTDENKRLEGIGTACHEFSHCLGYPDMYDTNGQHFYGMGTWSIMAEGDRSAGFEPAPYTAYERMIGGWLTPIELTSPQIVSSMPAIANEPVAYIIYNDANRDEYYLFANHQKDDRWEKATPSHGMLIMHVTYDEEVWKKNRVNATSFQHITFIPADNTISASSVSTDLWDGVNGHAIELTDESTPAATLYTPNSQGKYFMSKPISCIKEKDGLIRFVFLKQDAVDVPADLKVEATAKDSTVALSWSPVSGAEKYRVQYQGTDPDFEFPPEFELYEDFSNFEDAPKNTNLASELNNYTIDFGWIGKHVYKAENGYLAIGTESKAGELETPLIDEPENGNVTLSIMAYQYNTAENEITIELTDDNGTQVKVLQNLTDTTNHVTNIVNFENVKSDYYVTIRGKNRALLSEIILYNTKTTLDEILKFPELYPKGFFNGDENMTPVMYVDDITDTNTVIGGLNAHWNYSFRVRALGADDLYSLWSEPVTFVIPAAASGIRTIESDSLDFRRQPIYDLMGRRMPNSWESLPKGIYIINGKKIVK